MPLEKKTPTPMGTPAKRYSVQYLSYGTLVYGTLQIDVTD